MSGAAAGRNIVVEYFALFREQAGTGREEVSTRARTPAELYEELRDRHGLSLEAQRIRVAVNDEFAPWNRELQEGDRVVFIPPVAGG